MAGFPVITISSRDGVEVLHRLMHLGIREHLTSPIQASTLAKAVVAAAGRLKAHPVSAPSPADLFTFLPAKPGVGTSTIAMSTSCALAEELDVKTLLLEGTYFLSRELAESELGDLNLRLDEFMTYYIGLVTKAGGVKKFVSSHPK
jgi:hypothetical protein